MVARDFRQVGAKGMRCGYKRAEGGIYLVVGVIPNNRVMFWL